MHLTNNYLSVLMILFQSDFQQKINIIPLFIVYSANFDFIDLSILRFHFHCKENKIFYHYRKDTNFGSLNESHHQTLDSAVSICMKRYRVHRRLDRPLNSQRAAAISAESTIRCSDCPSGIDSFQIEHGVLWR